MTDCEYCSPKKTLFADGTLEIFFARKAAAPGHLVIIPKKHFTIFEQVPDNSIKQMFSVANKLSTILFDTLGVQGTNVIVENGNAAGQKIPHFSISIIPRKDGDGLNLQWAPKKISESEMSLIETQLKEEASKVFPDQEEARPAELTGPKEEIIEEDETEEDYLLKQLERIP